MKFKRCEIVVDSEFVVSDIASVCERFPCIKEWAYIKHDKDGLDAHFHIYLDFGKTLMSTSLVERIFDFDVFSVFPFRGSRKDALLYLIHALPLYHDEYQYSPEDVVASFDYVSFIKRGNEYELY